MGSSTSRESAEKNYNRPTSVMHHDLLSTHYRMERMLQRKNPDREKVPPNDNLGGSASLSKETNKIVGPIKQKLESSWESSSLSELYPWFIKEYEDCRYSFLEDRSMNQLDKGARSLFLALKNGASNVNAVQQLAYILSKEKTKTIIKIDFDREIIEEQLKKSEIKNRLVFDSSVDDIQKFLDSRDKILVVTSEGDSTLKGFEVPQLVVFSNVINLFLFENIFTRCKSKLIVVCPEEITKKIVPSNASVDFARMIPVYDELMPVAFEDAIRNNNLEKLQTFLDGNNPLPLDVRNETSQNGLMIACANNAETVLEVLLEKDCDMDAVDALGWTALHHAAHSGSEECLRIILRAGMDVDAITNIQETALHLAVEKGHSTIMDILMMHSCLINVRSLRRLPDYPFKISRTPLHLAAEIGRRREVLKLLRKQADPSITDQNYETALEVAVRSGNYDIAKILQKNSEIAKSRPRTNSDVERLELKHLINQFGGQKLLQHKNKSLTYEDFEDVLIKNIKASPLHFASARGYLDVVQFLVNESALDVNLQNDQGWTPLHLASFKGHLGVAKFLIKEGIESIHLKNAIGETPLHLASENGHIEIVKILLKEGKADINLKNQMSETPLHLAAERKHLDVVKFLVTECNADINLKNKIESTPLHHASESGNLDIVKYLVEKGKSKVNLTYDIGMTPLCLASENGHLNVVKFLVMEGKTDINLKNDVGSTALHLASKTGHLDVVKYFVEEFEADVDLKNDVGSTPLHLASGTGHLDVVKYLVEECRADVTLNNYVGSTPLDIASETGHLDVVKYLVNECQTYINLKNCGGSTPLHLASKTGHLDVVKYLVKECGADVDLKNDVGSTPLHLASKAGHLDVVKYLVKECRADVNLKNDVGSTPLHIVSENGHLDVVKYLENECQTDVNDDPPHFTLFLKQDI